MLLPTYQKTYKLAFYFALLLLIGDAVLQFYLDVQPCLLVYLERITMIVLASAFLAGAIHTPTIASKKLYNWIILLIGLVGLFIAGRHVWLQQFPPANPLVPIDSASLIELLQMAFLGTPDCIVVHWSWAGISLAMLTFASFLLFIIITFLQMQRKR